MRRGTIRGSETVAENQLNAPSRNALHLDNQLRKVADMSSHATGAHYAGMQFEREARRRLPEILGELLDESGIAPPQHQAPDAA